MRSRAALAALLALPAPACAALSASGYLKNLYQYGRTPVTRARGGLDLTRVRLSLEGSADLPSPGTRLKVHADYDQELRAGPYFHTPDYRVLGLGEPPSYLDMEQVIGTGGSYHWRHRLYRAWAGLESERWTLRFGRQRVAWGSGKLWNPTDVVNPYEPAAVEREERRGADALYVRRSAGTLGQAEGVWALGERWAAMDLLARVKGTLGGADAALMGGKVASSTSSWMAGSDASADLWGGNLHGELSYTELKTRSAFWKFMAGYEYSFSASPPVAWLKDAWVLAEYFHNGAGERDAARYDPARLFSGREVALAQDYWGWGFTKDLHPLVKLEIYGIVNLDDGSHFLGPSVAWNAVRDLHLTAGIQRFGGSARSEFGRQPNILHLQAQYYF